jgi:hypothetical protein
VRLLVTFSEFWVWLAFFALALVYNGRARRGFGPPGEELALRWSLGMAFVLRVEVAKKCLWTA